MRDKDVQDWGLGSLDHRRTEDDVEIKMAFNEELGRSLNGSLNTNSPGV